jgi:hypothetical protein
MLMKRPEPGANIIPHVVPKAKKSECIYLLPLCLQGTMLKKLATVTNLQILCSDDRASSISK